MNVTTQHIKKKKIVGSLNHQQVWEVETTGGLFLLAVQKSGKTEVLGSGPHRALARFIAEKKEKDLKLMTDLELSKSEPIPLATLQSFAPKFEAYTAAVNAEIERQGK